MVSYGKCQHCGMYGMLRGFWYNGEALTPDYLCDRCMLEFDMAMEESQFWTLHAAGLDDPDWDADAALKTHMEEMSGKGYGAYYDAYIPQPHTEFPLTKEQYEQMQKQNPSMWEKCLFSPSRQTGYMLDPENDPRDRELMMEYAKHERI